MALTKKPAHKSAVHHKGAKKTAARKTPHKSAARKSAARKAAAEEAPRDAKGHFLPQDKKKMMKSKKVGNHYEGDADGCGW